MPTFKCPQCGGEFQAESEGKYHCPHCENTVAIHLHVHGKVAWETWRHKGRFSAFIETWKNIMTNPVSFYKRVPKRGNFVLPLYYGIICQSIAIILMWSYQAGFHSIPVLLDYTAAFGGYWPWTFHFDLFTMGIFLMALCVVAPLFAILGLSFMSGIFHICLKVFGGAKEGYEATFRAICYASSAQVLGVIPIVGGVVAGVWSLVLSVIGIKEMHGTTYSRAVIAVVLPVITCCGFIMLVVAAVFGAALGAWMSGGEV